MTGDPKTLTLDDKVETCLKFMDANKVRHVPIIELPEDTEKEEEEAKGKDNPKTEEEKETPDEEAKPYFVGVVSDRDVFRQISPYLGKAAEEDTDSKALTMPVGQIATRNPKSVSPETPMPDVIATMIDNRIDMVPVVADAELVGIITAGDIVTLFRRLDALRQLAPQDKSTRLVDLVSGGPGEAAALLSSLLRSVESIMTEQVACLAPQDNLAKAVEFMQQKRIRHAPIVDEQGRLVGIVSDRDILRNLPFAGAQRPSKTEEFRSQLFAVDSKDRSLRLSLRNVMTPDVVHILPTCSVYEAAKTLDEMRGTCLPVVDENNGLRGIVTVTDLMRALLAAYKLTEKCQGQPAALQQVG